MVLASGSTTSFALFMPFTSCFVDEESREEERQQAALEINIEPGPSAGIESLLQTKYSVLDYSHYSSHMHLHYLHYPDHYWGGQ